MTGWTCRCIFNGVQEEFKIPRSQSIAGVRASIAAAASQPLPQDYVLTDFNKDIHADSDLDALDETAVIWVKSKDKDEPLKERIQFPPHPKTLTRAGDYEYFAAQGRTPFPYALAELIDNSLRATMRGRLSQRKIVISFVLSNPSNPASGLISIWDNGCGMTSQALNEWAVMNLSMEDRGDKPTEQPVQRGDKTGLGATRFLDGNLSYFGVGSKNAAFYIGKCIKVATQHKGSTYVHELGIAASDLEQRYREGKAVYEEDLLHRKPGTGAAHPFEANFQAAKEWIQMEDSQEDSQEGLGPASFTRIVVGDLKPEILQIIGKTGGREQLCKSLAHLYHYYLHGEKGNLEGKQMERNPDLPQIHLECIIGSAVVWQCELANVADDLESLYLQAQKAELHFSLEVAGKGQVDGVLWYFPFQNETESLPIEDSNLVQNPITSYNMTQQPANRASQMPTQHQQRNQNPGKESPDVDDEDIPLWQRSKGALFEAFWQGRLIPGARIESLPFIEAVRLKRGAAGKDVVPDESFLRLRGALFFGPGFLVTRNKLTFRDNLQELLRGAVPRERAQEKTFRDWIAKCHNSLDKAIRFESLASKEIQAVARKLLSKDTTAFERIVEGARSVQRGDVVRLQFRPPLIGRVEFFSIPLDIEEEGAYANGHVTVQPIPEAIFGKQPWKSLPLRRIEATLSEAETEEHCAREMLKVPSSIELASQPESLHFQPDGTIPETAAHVLNGTGQKVTRGHLGGEKLSYSLCQRLWFCPSGVSHVDSPAEEPVPKKVKKAKRKGGKQPPLAAIAELQGPTTDAELVTEHLSSNPGKEAFHFPAIAGCLTRAGTYLLQYVMHEPVLATPAPACSLELTVRAGPAVELLVQGEARQAMATADLMLGEWLPDVHLTFQDAQGNTTMAGIDLEAHPSVDVYTGDEDVAEDIARVPDLETYFVKTVSEDSNAIVLSNLQILGHKEYQPGSGPLSIFAQASAIPDSEDGQRAAHDDLEACTRRVLVNFAWPGFPALKVPLKLLPGLPRSLQLLANHPFQSQVGEGSQQLEAISLPSGSTLPDFAIQALDVWENPTRPCPEMPFDLIVTSSALEPDESTIHFEPIANVTGLKAGKLRADLSSTSEMTCRLIFPGATEEAAREVLGGAELPTLKLAICLEPSTAPAAIKLFWKSNELQQQVSEEGASFVVIEDVAAGSSLSDLAMVVVDELGRPSVGPTGKMQVSWARGGKRVTLTSEPIPLPDLELPEVVSDKPTPSWVRFSPAGQSVIEMALHATVTASEPHAWTASAADVGPETQGVDADGHVQCGQFFRLDIAAVDAFNNRCCGNMSHQVPCPIVVPESTDGSELVYDQAEWEQGWTERADRGQVYSIKMKVGGNPGTIRLHVRDQAGDDGASSLQADCLDVLLEAGAPTCLMFDAPSKLDCGMRSTLAELRMRATDDYGNTAPASFEVALLPSAVCSDDSGQSAAVTAQGGNKARVKKGKAIFKDVQFSAEAPGSYVLRAKPTSREVAGEAAVTVQLVAVNLVQNLALESLCGKSLVAGSCVRVEVACQTEDGKPVPGSTAKDGLEVKLSCSNSMEQAVVMQMVPCEASTQTSYIFESESITDAGTYAVTAQYTERRPGLAPTRRSNQGSVQAVALELDVCAAPPSAISLVPALPASRITVTNGSTRQDRLLLKAAAIQVQDEYGNEVAAEAVRVSAELRHSESAQDGELPILDMAERPRQQTDCHGRAYFGDIYIKQGSGCASDAGCEIELRFSAELPNSSCECNCPVLFTDDGQRYAAMRELAQRHEALLEKKQQLRGTLSCAQKKRAAADTELASAKKAAEACMRESNSKVAGLEDAEKALAAVRQCQQQQSSEPQASMAARFGGPDQALTKSLTRCLQASQEGMIGVFAQLATVDHPELARILAAQFRGMLTVLVVENRACQVALDKLCEQHRLLRPDIMCMTNVLQYERTGNAEVPGWTQANDMAVQLQSAACDGTDPALPVALPHTRAINYSRREIPNITLGPNEWPTGCIGYAFNLVRPALRGYRALLLYPMFSQTLVFDTLQNAQNYREYCCQVLRQNISDIVTLDLRRLTGKGIISGASFKVPALESSSVRFGSTPANQMPQMTQACHQEAVLEQLVDLLKAQEQAHQAAVTAQQEESEARLASEEQLNDIEEQIRAIDVQLGSQAPGALNSASKRRRRQILLDKENADPTHAEYSHQTEDGGAKAKPKKRKLTKARPA